MANSSAPRPQGTFLKLSEAEMQVQLTQYATLPFSKTVRGQATILGLVFFGLSIITAFLGVSSWIDVLVNIVVLGPVLWCVARGHRWAMIVFPLLWIAQMILGVAFSSEDPSPIFFFWVVIIGVMFWRALSVENVRKKKRV